MPRAKENSYIFVSPGFVWPLQARRVGVLLRERDAAKAVTGRNRAGRVEKAGGREKAVGFGGRGAVVETFDLIRLASPPGRAPHLSLCHKAIPISSRFLQSRSLANASLPSFSQAATSFA